MGLMASGGENNTSENISHWMYQKHLSFSGMIGKENTKSVTLDIFTSMVEEAIRKAIDRVNYFLER